MSQSYINHGGVGFLSNDAGELDIPDCVRNEPLKLIEHFNGSVLREVRPPEFGWDHANLSTALEAQRPLILSFAPVDAMLGIRWMGSTEL